MNKDELVFDFKLDTNLSKQLLWSCDKSIEEPFGTLAVQYTNGPCDIDIFINGNEKPIKTLNPGESYSRTCCELNTIEISPKGSSTFEKVCCGKLGLSINHEYHNSNSFTILFIMVILLALLPYFYCKKYSYPTFC